MKRAALGIAAVLAILYIALCTLLFVYQRSLLYEPTSGKPADGTKFIAMQVDGARVLVGTREHIGRKAILYFGGNGEDVSQSLPDMEAAFPDHAVYLLHYRGYDGSTGQPSERALVADALTLFDKVVKEHPDITVVGRSLGSGIAVQVASQRPAEKLVLVTPYDSIAEVAASQYPFVPVRWLLQDKYESWKFAPKIRVPTLVIEAENDEVISRERTDALVRRFPAGAVTLKTVQAAGHDTISESAQYVPILAGR